MNKLDPKNTYGALAHFADQCEQAWTETKKLSARGGSAFGGKIRNVIIAGMGGSALGAHVVETALFDRLRVPYNIVRGYKLPSSVGRRTLVILSSYSGTTEEVLSAFEDARRRGAAIIGISEGGPLTRRLRQLRLPHYTFVPRYNPGNQPRLGTGYLIFSLVGILARAGLLAITETEVRLAIAAARLGENRWGTAIPLARNHAKRIAQALEDRLVVPIASEHLVGAAHVFQNRIHETSKHLAFYQEVPELNHHLMEGLAHPRTVSSRIIAVFFSSDLYHKRIRQRYAVTADVFRKNGARTIDVPIMGKTKFEQAILLISLAGYVSFYLAMRHRVNPAPIPWVDYFKKKLGR